MYFTLINVHLFYLINNMKYNLIAVATIIIKNYVKRWV